MLSRSAKAVRDRAVYAARKAADPAALSLVMWHRQLWTNFRMTPAQYDELYKKQNGCCACCGRPQSENAAHRGGPRRLVVDHDHVTGVVRGLLCQFCNVGIGQLGDNMAGLMKAVAYLEASWKTRLPQA